MQPAIPYPEPMMLGSSLNVRMRPIGNPIILTGTYVSGLMFTNDPMTVYAEMSEGDTLQLSREPTNDYDRRAIAIMDAKGRKVGYVPHSINCIIANLMDGGKDVYAQVGSLEKRYGEPEIWIDIVMDDFRA